MMMMNNKAKSFDQSDLDRQRNEQQSQQPQATQQCHQYLNQMDKKKQLLFKDNLNDDNNNIVQFLDKMYNITINDGDQVDGGKKRAKDELLLVNSFDDNPKNGQCDHSKMNNKTILDENHMKQEKIQMKYRNIGKNGLRVPIIAFAAWNSFSTNCSESMADQIITSCLNNGVNYFDTGDIFDNGHAEILLGKVLNKKKQIWPRNTYLISTKLFWKNGPSAHLGAGLSRKFIVEAIEASLKRLRMNYIDIVVIHKLDAMCPMEELVRTMSYLINRGLIFYWATSRFSTIHIAEAFSIARQFNCPPPICEQMEYHMFQRDKMELQMLELFHKAGIGCITWSPISMADDPGIQLIRRRLVNENEQRKLDQLKQLCDQLQCDLTQLSLAWCLQNENVNCILITATTADEFYGKLNSIKIYPVLTKMVNDEIEAILENDPVKKRQQMKAPSITIDIVNTEQCLTCASSASSKSSQELV